LNISAPKKIFSCTFWAALFLVVLLPWYTSGQTLKLPDLDKLPEWEKDGPVQRFGPEGLYNHINGGAELFLEFGFRECLVQSYRKADQEIGLEVYRMDNPTAALGIYLMKCGRETPITELPARNSSGLYQFTILKHDCFFQVNNFSGEAGNHQAMIYLAQAWLAAQPDAPPNDIFIRLPEENLVPGSRRIFRGPFGLQPLYTFGTGDILSQKNELFGISGEYTNQDASTYTRIILVYPAAAAAEQAYAHLLANLDPYISILHKITREFTFKDYQNRFGRVSLRGEILDIKVNLTSLDNL